VEMVNHNLNLIVETERRPENPAGCEACALGASDFLDFWFFSLSRSKAEIQLCWGKEQRKTLQKIS